MTQLILCSLNEWSFLCSEKSLAAEMEQSDMLLFLPRTDWKISKIPPKYFPYQAGDKLAILGCIMCQSDNSISGILLEIIHC